MDATTASGSNLESVSTNMTSGHFDVADGVKLYYELRRPAASGTKTEKLVMIMGAFATLKHFEEQANFMVNHFATSSTAPPLEILTYDHRGIGKSTGPMNQRQTTRMLANDAFALINHVWGDSTAVHVYGASMGGMVAQELAVSLVKSKRLRSLYLVVTSRGSFIRPMAAISTGAWSLMMPLLIKDDREKMIREVLIPASFSPETIKDQGEKYAKLWIENYDDWWAFGNKKACAGQASAAASHFLTNEGVRAICDANVPITVQIATKDKLMPVKKQRELAVLFKAKTVVFDQGHMGDDKVKQELFNAAIVHIESAISM